VISLKHKKKPKKNWPCRIYLRLFNFGMAWGIYARYVMCEGAHKTYRNSEQETRVRMTQGLS